MPPRNHFAAAHAAIALDRKIIVHLERLQFLGDRLKTLGSGRVDRDVATIIMKEMKKLTKKVDTMSAKSRSLVPPVEDDDDDGEEDPQ